MSPELCLGLDKIGHFFQQGLMLYEVMKWGQARLGNQKKGEELAKAFAELTEGLYNEQSYSKEVNEALRTGWTKFTYSGKWEALMSYDRKWGNKYIIPFPIVGGGIYWCAPSAGDVAAGLAGAAYYQILKTKPQQAKFDICDPVYGVNKNWLEPPLQ